MCVMKGPHHSAGPRAGAPVAGSKGGNLCVFQAHTCEDMRLCASCECMYVCMEGVHLSVRGAWCMHIYEGYACVPMGVSRGRVCLSAHTCVRVCVLCTCLQGCTRVPARMSMPVV